MKMQMMFSNGHLSPSSESSAEDYKKLREGNEYSVELKKARNPKFHRKAFKLIKVMFDNQEQYDDMRSYRRMLKVKTGSVETYFVGEQMIMELKSWDFASMDDLEFERLYKRILDVAMEQYGYDMVAGFA